MQNVLITGGAGFIGSSLQVYLSEFDDFRVGSLDNFNPVYGTNLPLLRSQFVKTMSGGLVDHLDLLEVPMQELTSIFDRYDVIIHLAAFPGVRASSQNPFDYSKNNVHSFDRVLEAFRFSGASKLFFASSSSVYGDQPQLHPTKENVANGLNLKSHYAVTKWINELAAKSVQQICGKTIVGLRFFTVIGPYGRPDMAYWDFTRKIISNSTISLYGDNGGSRSFTDIRDLNNIIHKLLLSDIEGFHIFNTTNSGPTETIKMLEIISRVLEKKPVIEIVSRPTEDVYSTWADFENIQQICRTEQIYNFSETLEYFVRWYVQNANRITYLI